MNWMTPVCRQVMDLKQCSREHRDLLVLWVNELSVLCDRYRSDAPAPNVEYFTEDEVCEEGRALTSSRRACVSLSWLWQGADRSFAIFVSESPHEVELMVSDTRRHEHRKNPSHEILKSYLQAFFAGWSPRTDGH